jgi:hypothetical protein
LINQWDQNIINDITYYYAEDFYIMKGEILNLFNEIKALCQELNFYIYEDFEKDKDGNEYLNYISYSKLENIKKYSNQCNEIEFTVNFKNKFCDEEGFKHRLICFKNFLIDVKNNNINIANRKQMTSDELNFEWERTQLQEYDYKFFF